jgi:hypothetical protein
MVLAFLAAAVVLAATAPALDAPHAAVLKLLPTVEDAGACSPAEQWTIAKTASIRPIGRLGGDDVVLAAVYGSCLCGAQNCPFYAIRLAPGKPRVLLATYGIDARVDATARPLPWLRVTAHDSAAVSVQGVYEFRNGAYAETQSMRVRNSDGAKKIDRPVRFAAGASSAELRGSVSIGWYDVYTFDAAKGQRLTIGGVRSKSKLTATLYPPGNGEAIAVKPGVPAPLPRSGTYRLQIDDDSEEGASYALNLAIR